MPNKLPNNADRYTLVLCKPNEIEAKITACSELGLTWIAGPRGSGMRSRIEFHVFFDNAGKENYMNGFYDESDEDSLEPIEWVLFNDSDEDKYLSFVLGDFSASVSLIDDETHTGGFSFTVMCGANVLMDAFAGSVAGATLAAEKTLREAMKEGDGVKS